MKAVEIGLATGRHGATMPKIILIEKILVSTSIWHESNTIVSDTCLHVYYVKMVYIWRNTDVNYVKFRLRIGWQNKHKPNIRLMVIIS